MKKVGLLTLEYPPTYGGVGRYYHRLVQESDGAIQVFDVEQLQMRNWLRLLKPVHNWVRQREITHVLVGHVLPLGTVMWLVSLFTGVRYTVFVHGMDIAVPQRYKRKRWLVEQILKRAHSIITVSQFTKEHIARLHPVAADKIHIVSPGPFIERPAEVPSGVLVDAPVQPYIVSIGRIVKRKGFDYTVRALHALAAEGKALDVQYRIIGQGPYQAELQQLIDDLRLSDRVRVVSGQTDEQVAEWLANCQALFMPSRVINSEDFEGFGIVVLEANVFGKIAVGGRTAGMQDAILHSKTGLLVDPDSIDDIASALTRILDHPEQIRSMEAQAEQWVQSEHNWNKKYRTLAKIIGLA